MTGVREQREGIRQDATDDLHDQEDRCDRESGPQPTRGGGVIDLA